MNANFETDKQTGNNGTMTDPLSPIYIWDGKRKFDFLLKPDVVERQMKEVEAEARAMGIATEIKRFTTKE